MPAWRMAAGSSPKRSAMPWSRGGMTLPESSQERRICLTLVTGMMPATMGTPIPLLSARNRKR